MHTLYCHIAIISLFFSSLRSDAPDTSFVMSNVSVNKNRVFAVVCNTPSADGGRVLLKVCDSTNTPIIPTIIVNKIFSGVGQNADVVIDNFGIVTIVWEQFINSRIQIGLARFGFNGNEIEQPMLIKDDHSLADQLPRIALGKDGRFVVIWQALNVGISGQRFSKAAKKIGTIFNVSPKPAINPQYPSVRINSRNHIAVVWQEGSNDDFRIVLRVFDWQFRPSQIVQVDDAKGQAYFSNPDLLFLGSGNLVVAWKDYRSGEANIYQQIFDTKLKPVGNNFRVNDDTGRQWQRLPRLAGNEGSNYAIVWEDYRNDPINQIGDIYVQLFKKNGYPIRDNYKIEVECEPTSQRFPSAVMSGSETLFITWSDTRNSNSSIYMANMSLEGKQNGTEQQVFP